MKLAPLALLALVAGCDGGPTGTGTVSVGWAIIYDDGIGTPGECADVGGVEVEVTLSGGGDEVETFPCEDEGGVFVEVGAGGYDFAGELRDASGAVLQEGEPFGVDHFDLEADHDVGISLRFRFPPP